MKFFINEHSSVKIESEDKIIYFDPFKIETESHDANVIFITHSHFDHFSPEDISKVSNADTRFVMPFSMKDDTEPAMLNEKNIIFVNPDDIKETAGIKFIAIAAYNTDKPMHKKEFGWVGYVVGLEGKNIYVPGDIDAIPEGEELKVDVAFVPVGGTYTMNYKEAAEFINKMKPGKTIPYHYGSLVGSPDDGEKFISLVDESIDTEILL